MTQIFQKLYCLPNHQIRKNTNFASFLFTGKNWDYYFTTKVSKNCEILENVVLTETYDKKRFIDKDWDNKGVYLLSK
jgi:hypothetical protein